MTRKIIIRLMWWSLAIAVIAVSAWWIWGGLLEGWLFALYTPAQAVTIFISGNPHNINPVVGFIAQIIQSFLMIYIVAIGIVTTSTMMRRRHKVECSADGPQAPRPP